MNAYVNNLQQAKNTEKKYLVKYRLTDKGHKIYEFNEKLFENDADIERFKQ